MILVCPKKMRTFVDMTEQEIKLLNYKNGKNNYILKGNAQWVAFQKNIVDKLIAEFQYNFNIVIYWYSTASTNEIDYICVPYSVVLPLMSEEHLSHKKDGTICWNFIIKGNLLMVHANSNFSINIEDYLNINIGNRAEHPSEYSANEGKEKYRIHKQIERNSTIVKQVKNRKYLTDPWLHCEICGFSFRKAYGDLGKEYIEAHHKIPLSELSEETETKESDFALVCSNCHRMLHRRIPALKSDELRKLLMNNPSDFE